MPGCRGSALGQMQVLLHQLNPEGVLCVGCGEKFSPLNVDELIRHSEHTKATIGPFVKNVNKFWMRKKRVPIV